MVNTHIDMCAPFISAGLFPFTLWKSFLVCMVSCHSIFVSFIPRLRLSSYTSTLILFVQAPGVCSCASLCLDIYPKNIITRKLIQIYTKYTGKQDRVDIHV